MNKIIKVSIGGTPTPGDVVSLSYSVGGRGKTATGHIVRDSDSLADIASGLAGGVLSHWCDGLFTVKATGADLTIIERCPGDVVVSGEVEHIVGEHHWIRAPGGSETVTVEA